MKFVLLMFHWWIEVVFVVRC